MRSLGLPLACPRLSRLLTVRVDCAVETRGGVDATAEPRFRGIARESEGAAGAVK